MSSRDVGIIGYGSSVYEKKASRTEMGYLAESATRALARTSSAPGPCE